jgi:hypothetical protein
MSRTVLQALGQTGNRLRLITSRSKRGFKLKHAPPK